MTLDEAIAEVQAVTRVTYPWTGDDFTCAQPEHDPTKTDNAIATILNAVASGDLIPLADHRLAVALVVEKAAVYSINESRTLTLADADALKALRADRDEMAAEVHGHIKMWGDALRRAEAAEAEFAMARTDADQTRIALRAAEAEVARLREALTRIEGKDSWIDASIRSDGPERKVMRGEFGEIARAALQPKAAP